MTNNLVKISVVIPVYNVKNYVQEAVDSILAQTIAPYEIIIVDDGSTDGSGELLDECYGHLDTVKIVHTENHGLGEARNEGSRHVTGDFTYYFDSDDIAVPTLLETFLNIYRNHPDLDIFCFSADSFFDTEPAVKQPLPHYDRKMDRVFPDAITAFNTMSGYGVFYPNAWMYVFRSRLITDNNIWFEPIIHEDEEFTPRLFLSAGKIAVSRAFLFKRRVRAGSIMQSGRGERNVIGYIACIKAQEQLRQSVINAKVKRHLSDRIAINIISIMNIIKDGQLKLSDDVAKQLSELKERNKSMMVTLSHSSPYAYKILSFVKRRINRIIYA
ncbi:capsular biosynthesis protein [Serratia sp. MYb239]|uniref:glycosyltransferase n=1 Tax=Serratia sp. MYb239 TaxID=2033438 RepID=UPI000CF64610|nr:glycosyltransferase [Serratia sp. MYb239]AVJ16957.1 capsular biosynthesis protein [Serratia sp. MYb239]MCA4822973.1 glycosyltransferase [Serratia rubidaea]SQJ23088.1 Chondroitin polymerase [Serratia rubidaea]